MSSFDLLCWELMRINFIITEITLEMILPYIKDPKLSLKLQMYLISANALKTMNLEDIPSTMRAKVIAQGQLLFFLIVGSILIGIYL